MNTTAHSPDESRTAQARRDEAFWSRVRLVPVPWPASRYLQGGCDFSEFVPTHVLKCKTENTDAEIKL